jgi:predicted Zn-dependent protease with MMP-like domain
MIKISAKEFEKIVNKGIKDIPDKFLQKLNNVAIVVEDEPLRIVLREHGIKKGWTLYGLYQGIPQAKRGSGYGGVLPDKITIFKNPIEEAASSRKDIQEIVKLTVWHEIAHHFGMNEFEVRLSENKRKEMKKA